MSAPAAKKRARTFKNARHRPTTPPTNNDIPSTISTLSPYAAHQLLRELVSSYPGTTSLVAAHIASHAEVAKSANAPYISSDRVAEAIWNELNVKHAKKSEDFKDNEGYFIAERIDEQMGQMMTDVKWSDRWDTRVSAMEACRRIAESIISCPSPAMRSSVMAREEGQTAGCMASILKTMTEKGEVQRLREVGMEEKVRRLDGMYAARGDRSFSAFAAKLSAALAQEE